ncbi:MAG: ADP-forming succinate--CoA ligase subunit beta [Proteobacteria bacterium]|nr:ADP-forming succinate--CoA ligase subunit beta [Pseudomonadota bacterium]
MKIHEYQAKARLREYGIKTPEGVPCFTVEEAVAGAQQLGGNFWVVKAQIHAGGRGKAGGVLLAKSLEEVREHASNLLGKTLVTPQTGPQGQQVRRLYIESGVDIALELYVGVVVDRSRRCVTFMGSSEGGTEIEEVAAATPEKIHKVFVDPSTGMLESEAREMCIAMGVPEQAVEAATGFMMALYTAFVEEDASLAEINPLVVTGAGEVVALDAKINFDDNASFRHPVWQELRDTDEEDPVEVEADKVGLNFISLDGSIGCLVNGAGLAMATMDIIKLYGGSPANFLDVGGGANAEQVTAAFKIMLKSDQVKAIMVNIFGGIMRCDVIAQGIVQAAKEVQLEIPLIVRLEGTNVEQGRQILAESGIQLITATTMSDAAEKAVKAVA